MKEEKVQGRELLRHLLSSSRLVVSFEAESAAIIFGHEGDSSSAYSFRWIEKIGTYELIFGAPEWEGVFKSSPLVRDYLELVLSDLISYRQKIRRLIG